MLERTRREGKPNNIFQATILQTTAVWGLYVSTVCVKRKTCGFSEEFSRQDRIGGDQEIW